MTTIVRLLVAALFMLAPALSVSAQEQEEGAGPLWVRYPAIAPDGSVIAFTYRGQIYLVDAEGGLAVPVTSQGYYSYGGVWAPDSEKLAFASDINGDDDIYLTDFSGTLERLTWSSAAETPASFSPDGTALLFEVKRLGDPLASVQGPLTDQPQLYTLDLETGRESLLLPNLAQYAGWNSDHTSLVYSRDRSFDPIVRQHRVTSNAREIWLYDPASGGHTKLTDSAIDSLNPVWARDDSALFYLSEASGTLNVWRHDLEAGTDTQITRFSGHPVRHLSVSDAGDIVFSQSGVIWRLPAGSDTPLPVEIIVPEQIMEQPRRHAALGTQEFISSPDGFHFAAVFEGDVFLIDRAGRSRQITSTPAIERNVAFSPDGSMLVYAAQRDHLWGIYGVELTPFENGDAMALSGEEFPLVSAGDLNAFRPVFSPDGTRIAFIADRREVKVLDIETGAIITLFAPEDYNTQFTDADLWASWSPTSDDLVVQWRAQPMSGFNTIAIVPADGSGQVTPIPAAVADLDKAFWSADGTSILALTQMFGLRTADQNAGGIDVYQIFLSEQSRRDFLDIYEDVGSFFEGPGPQRYSLDTDRPQRLERRVTAFADNLMVVAASDDPVDLLILAPNDAGQPEVAYLDLETGARRTIAVIDMPDATHIAFQPELGLIDIKGPQGILTIPMRAPEQRAFVPLDITYQVLPSARRAAAFEQAWADLKYTFYRSDLEGRDWDAIGANYRAYLDSIASDRELSELIDEMYGELSASHLFVGYHSTYDRTWMPTETGTLGVYIDYGHEGPGRRVKDILPGGPLDRNGIDIDPGDVIVSVDGEPVPDAGGLDRLLDATVGRQVTLGVIEPGGETPRLVSVAPVSLAAESALAKERWVDSRRAEVAALSNGCVVYQYVPAMNNERYLEVYGRVMAATPFAKAALIDIRSNTGGNLHRQLLNFLTGEPFAYVGLENRAWGAEPVDRWHGPSAMLVDTFAYSDGSVFPQAYQDLEVGTIVGEPVLGTGTAINTIFSPLIEGLYYSIPVMPLRRLDGSYYENREIIPDIAVPLDPNAIGEGRDAQLQAAVAALMDQIGPETDCRVPGAF